MRIEGVEANAGAIAKLIPATARGTDAEPQPPQRVILVGVLMPLARFWLSPPQFKQHHGQHQIGPIRRFAQPVIGTVEGSQVEVGHGVSNLPCEMISGQFLVEFTPAIRVFSPGGLGKTSERLGIG